MILFLSVLWWVSLLTPASAQDMGKVSEFYLTQGVLGATTVAQTVAILYLFKKLMGCTDSRIADGQKLVEIATRINTLIDGWTATLKSVSDAQEARSRVAAEVVSALKELKEELRRDK